MTISETDKAIRELVKGYHIYGVETVVNALVRATIDEPYIDRDVIITLICTAYNREEK